jgi:acetyl-CoA acetyltransferase
MGNPRQATVVGLYVTKLARTLPGRRSQELIIEAVKGAIDDAGIDPKSIDGTAIEWAGPGGAPGDNANWAPYLRQPLAWTNDHFMDQAGARGVLKAAAAIEMGLCDTVVIGGGRAGPWSTDGTAVGAALNLEFADPFGSSTMIQFATVAQRHMHEFGTTPEQMAEVAAVIRNHGHVNPEAAMYGAGPYTVADILASPMITTPFHRLECCLIQEGACAIVMTTAERARNLKQRPVHVLGGGMEFYRGAYANPPLYREMKNLGKDAVRRACGRAGVTPHDIDVFNLYDAVSFEVIRQFEMLGLCNEGEGGAFIQNGRITLGGQCPTNLDGGLLSHAWVGTAQLTLKIIEGVRQLRGSCGPRQVEDAELALVTNAGSGAQHIELAILGRG